MNFTGMLVLFATAMFLAVVLLLRRIGKVTGENLKPKRRARWVFFVYCLLTGFFFLLSAYYAIVGQRAFIWFCIFALIGILSLYFGNSSAAKHRRFSILVIILVAVAHSSIPIIQNRGIIFGPDQWRDLKVTTFIIEKGTFNNFPGFETGFYSFVPLFNVLSAAFSQIVGWPTMTTFAVLQSVLFLVFAASVYAIVKKLSGQKVVPLVAVLLLIATPRLALVQAIPSTLSISLGFLLVLLFVKENVRLRSVILSLVILAFTIAVLHPVGAFPILLICFGIIAVSYLSTRERLAPQEISFTKQVFSICLLVTLTYWSADYRVFSGVFNPLKRFLLIFTSIDVSPSIYNPQYQGTGFELFSFAWALPVAFSAAYLAMILWSAERGKPRLNRDLPQHVIAVSAFAGLLLILGTFVSVLINPGAAVERYINMPAYALFILPSSFVLGQFLLSHNKAAVVFAIFLFSTNIVIGSMSPDWAPFESPTFGALRFTSTSVIEANSIVSFLPNDTRLYEDHDIPLAGVGSMSNISFNTDRSYQTTRNVIQRFKENSFTPFDPQFKGAVIVIKTDEIVDQDLFNNYVNVLYNSERHVVVVP